jgi:hypothetical protein
MVNGTAGDYFLLLPLFQPAPFVLCWRELEAKGVKHRGRTDELKKELEERNSESGHIKKKWRP